jgi:hypothetical protein
VFYGLFVLIFVVVLICLFLYICGFLIIYFISIPTLGILSQNKVVLTLCDEDGRMRNVSYWIKLRCR